MTESALHDVLVEVRSLREQTTQRLKQVEEALSALQTSADDEPSISAPILTRDDIFITSSRPLSLDGWAENPLYRDDGEAAIINLPEKRPQDERQVFQIDSADSGTGQETIEGAENRSASTFGRQEQEDVNSEKILSSISDRYRRRNQQKKENKGSTRGGVFWCVLHGATLHPEQKSIWDVFIAIIMLWVCVMSPYIVSFGGENDLPYFFHYCEMVVDVCFAIDILLTLNTAYLDEEGRPVRHRWKVFKRYAKGWLLVDLISVMPLHLLFFDLYHQSFLPIARMTKLIKMLRLLRAVRLLRLSRTEFFLRNLEGLVGSIYWKVARFMVIVTLLSHWCACIFHYVAYVNEDSDTVTWVKAAHVEECSFRLRYLTSLYWSLATMTSVGYGDIVAITVPEKIASVLCMMVGVTVFGYIMGAMTSLIGALNSTSARITAKRQRVDDFLRSRNVPAFLANKVREFYGYIVAKEFANDDSEIIGGLPNKLRTQIILFLFRDTLAKVLYFENKPAQFIAELVMMMKIEFYSPGDFVVVQGEMSSEMYIVVEGRLSIRAYDRIQALHEQLYCGEPVDVPYKTLGHIEMGSQFGEYACLTNEPRTATVVAETYCELYSLSRDGLNSVMDRWPQYKTEISQKIMEKSKARAPTPQGSMKVSPAKRERLTSSLLSSVRKRSSAIDLRSASAVTAADRRGVISVPKELEQYLHSPFATEDEESISLLKRRTTGGQ